MNNTLYFTLGNCDHTPEVASSTKVNLLNSQDKLGFGLTKFLTCLGQFGFELRDEIKDLLVVATSIYAADTSVSRIDCANDNFTRFFELHIPVQDKLLWDNSLKVLTEMLRFLTGDIWNLHFRSSKRVHSCYVSSPPLPGIFDFDHITLLSGGLDSLIGVIDLLSNGVKPLIVSHSWDKTDIVAQKKILDGLHAKYMNQFSSISASIGFEENDFFNAGSELSKRSRSFLFYSLGLACTELIESTPKFVVPENGYVALNIPLDFCRLGALSTRSTHPYFMLKMEQLAKNLGINVDLFNPYKLKSKGKMVAECSNKKLLKKMIPHSMSCSSPNKLRYESVKPMHCGVCYSCIVRRASLASGLNTSDKTEYYFQKFSDKKKRYQLLKLETVKSIEYLIKYTNVPDSKLRFLVKGSGPINNENLNEYVNVFKDGLSELNDFLTNANAFVQS